MSRNITEGAVRLLEYLRAHRLTIHAFCRQHGIDYAAVQRNLTGLRGARVSVDFASEIARATEGAVPLEAWHSSTLRPLGQCSGDSSPEAPTEAA